MLKETAEAYEKEGSYKEAIDAFQQVYIHHSSFRVRAKVIGFLVLGFMFFFRFGDTVITLFYCLSFGGGGSFFYRPLISLPEKSQLMVLISARYY